MLNFSKTDQKAQDICLYYAKQLGAFELMDILSSQSAVKSKEEATALSWFFWGMLKASAEDQDNGVEVLGEVDLRHWMECCMNVFREHLSHAGYLEQWDEVDRQF